MRSYLGLQQEKPLTTSLQGSDVLGALDVQSMYHTVQVYSFPAAVAATRLFMTSHQEGHFAATIKEGEIMQTPCVFCPIDHLCICISWRCSAFRAKS